MFLWRNRQDYSLIIMKYLQIHTISILLTTACYLLTGKVSLWWYLKDVYVSSPWKYVLRVFLRAPWSVIYGEWQNYPIIIKYAPYMFHQTLIFFFLLTVCSNKNKESLQISFKQGYVLSICFFIFCNLFIFIGYERKLFPNFVFNKWFCSRKIIFILWINERL